jgi:hypothetical protein
MNWMRPDRSSLHELGAVRFVRRIKFLHVRTNKPIGIPAQLLL